MEAHASAGNRPEALRAYRRFREMLTQELGTDPSPETEQLYMQLLA
jgi:DNA-binding SARP family transcriptional activator